MYTLIILTDVLTAVITEFIAVTIFNFGTKEQISKSRTWIFAAVFTVLEIAARIFFGKTAVLIGINVLTDESAGIFNPDATIKVFYTGWFIEAALIIVMFVVAAVVFRADKAKAVGAGIVFSAVVMFAETGILKLLPLISGIKEASCIMSIAYYFLGAVGFRLIVLACITAFYLDKLSRSDKMGNSLPAVRDINHKHIVAESNKRNHRKKDIICLFVLPLLTVISAYAVFACEVKIGISNEYIWLVVPVILTVADIILIALGHLQKACAIRNELNTTDACKTQDADKPDKNAETKKESETSEESEVKKKKLKAESEITGTSAAESLTKKKIIAFIIAGVLIFVLAFYGTDKIVNLVEQRRIDSKYQLALDIWLADPDSVSIIYENINITEEFFDKYGDSILEGDFTAAITEMRDNMYTFSYSVTYKNKHLFEEE